MRGKEVSYNERLFGGGGLRGWYHNARYCWVEDQLEKLPSDISIFELGCFDAKLTDHIPNGFRKYVGADANWEKGLDLGRSRFAGREDVRLLEMHDPADMSQFADGEFDVAVSMETLEHIPDDVVIGYLEQIARVTEKAFLVTVPNEMGPVFMAKYFGKMAFGGVDQPHSVSEFIGAATFRPNVVERDQHKGFDYRKLVQDMIPFFTIEHVGPVPSMPVPAGLGLSIGIIAKPR